MVMSIDDASRYMTANPDVKRAAMATLAARGEQPTAQNLAAIANEHYTTYGQGEGRNISFGNADYVSQPISAESQAILNSINPDGTSANVISGGEANNPDLVGGTATNQPAAATGASATTEWAPPEGFNAYEYLTLNPDVRAAGADALDHYRQFGQNEGRKYDIAGIDLQNDALRYFDADYYGRMRPDVLEAGVDPLEHYINFGRFEGTYQSPLHQYAAQLMQFDPQYYLSQNQDVADAMRSGSMLSPLQHFSLFGANEGRSPYEGWTAPQPQQPWSPWGQQSPTAPWGRQPWQTPAMPIWGQPNYFSYNPMMPSYGMGYGGMGMSQPNYFGGSSFGGFGSPGGFGGFGRMAGGALGGSFGGGFF